MSDSAHDDQDLRHVRWLVGCLIRDEGGHLVIAPHALANVERTLLGALDDPATSDEVIDQVLRFVQGALLQGGEVDLARTLVSLVLAHPAGRARLEDSADKTWTKFAVPPVRRAPVHDDPPPEGAVPLGVLYPKTRW